jgi:hypothetical protein
MIAPTVAALPRIPAGYVRAGEALGERESGRKGRTLPHGRATSRPRGLLRQKRLAYADTANTGATSAKSLTGHTAAATDSNTPNS